MQDEPDDLTGAPTPNAAPTELPERKSPDELSSGEKLVIDNIDKAINGVLAEAGAIFEGRYKSIAITHLETAAMFFSKAIVNDGIK